MTLFEYLAVAFSIVLGFSLTHLLGSVRSVFDPARRYSVHIGFFFFLLLLHPQLWWALWDLHDDAPWNLFTFFFTLAGPGLLYLMTTSAIPIDRSQLPRWKDHFVSSRRWIFGFTAAYAVWGIGEVFWVFGVPLFHPYRILQVSLLVVSMMAALLPSSRMDRIAVTLMLVFLIGGQLMFRINPGGYFTG
jgi:hypothetical protein